MNKGRLEKIGKLPTTLLVFGTNLYFDDGLQQECFPMENQDLMALENEIVGRNEFFVETELGDEVQWLIDDIVNLNIEEENENENEKE
jgi:hypothetical protein